MRTCTKCKQELDESRFSKSTHKNGNVYFNSYCYSCRTKYNREKYNNGIIGKKAIVTDTHKECMHCNEMLPLLEFSKSKKGSGGVISYCKKCYTIKYKDLEKGKLATAKYRKNNPERWRASHRIHQYNRKALIKATCDGTVTDKVVKDLLNKEYCCWCNKSIPASDRTIEHIIELSNGGLHSKDNLDMACFSCNSSRKNKNVKGKI